LVVSRGGEGEALAQCWRRRHLLGSPSVIGLAGRALRAMSHQVPCAATQAVTQLRAGLGIAAGPQVREPVEGASQGWPGSAPSAVPGGSLPWHAHLGIGIGVALAPNRLAGCESPAHVVGGVGSDGKPSGAQEREGESRGRAGRTERRERGNEEKAHASRGQAKVQGDKGVSGRGGRWWGDLDGGWWV
jgi:hypothetical protein